MQIRICDNEGEDCPGAALWHVLEDDAKRLVRMNDKKTLVITTN